MATAAAKQRKKEEKTAMQELREAAVETLEALGGKAFRDEQVIYEGDKLVLPENMQVGDAIRFLQNKEREENEETNFSRTFDYRPWDVAYCTFTAMRKFFGTVNHTKGQVMGFFGPQDTPPQMITIATGPGEIENVPWGGFRVPFLPKVQFYLDQQNSRQKGPLGQITATGAKKWQHAVEGVFRLIEDELRNHSIYKGKVFDGQQVPQFLDLSSVDPEKIVFAEETAAQIDANLWSTLRYHEIAAKHGLPFKRSILLAGDFGVGKTMAINRTLQIAEEEEITAILVRPGRDDLAQALMTARLYQPAIVAFEDVEVVADADQEDRSISQILDMFDGIESKNSKVMLVLTSNHVERLHKGMLRPGRLDAIIRIGTPDMEGVRKLVEVTIPAEQLETPIDWQRVYESMDGYLPAFVVEAAQRAIRYSLARNEGSVVGKITEEDLVYSGEGLRAQYDQMQEASDRSDLGTSLDRAFLDIQHRQMIEVNGWESEPGETPIDTIRRNY